MRRYILFERKRRNRIFIYIPLEYARNFLKISETGSRSYFYIHVHTYIKLKPILLFLFRYDFLKVDKTLIVYTCLRPLPM